MIKILDKNGNLLVKLDVSYLRHADLRHSDLRGANLRYADLRGADLHGADLRYADLRYADLSEADLRHSDLSGADLRYADLRGANLRGVNIIIITGFFWTTYITPGHIRIGCQSHTLGEWKKFSDDKIFNMDINAPAFWKENKELIIGLCERFEKNGG